MSFLTPLFLLGALAVAGPLVFHLIRRATRQRVPFSNTRLLVPSAPRLNRRSRIEHPWLLLLRCLIIAVLAVGFARPFFRDSTLIPPASVPEKHLVAIIDASASMQREGLWSAAVTRVGEIANKLDPADTLSVVVAGAGARTLVSADQWRGTAPDQRILLLKTALSDLTPGWSSANLGTSTEAAIGELEAMAEASGPSPDQRIHIISDLTESLNLAGLAGINWPADCRVVLEELRHTHRPNVSLHWLGWINEPGTSDAIRLKITNATDTPAAIDLAIDQPPSSPSVAALPDQVLAPRETRLVRIDIPATETGPFHARITGDDVAFDNEVWFVRKPEREIVVPVIGGGSASDPATAQYYLSRASTGWRDLEVSWLPLPATASHVPDNAPLVILAQPVDATVARAWLDKGLTLLALVTDESMLANVRNIAGLKVEPANRPLRAGAMLGTIDFAHPLFAPFADPRYSDFTHIRFWDPYPLSVDGESGGRVLARFEGGAAAVVEVLTGNGHLVVWPGDWTPEASQWVLSSKFVPWLHTLIENASGGPPRPNILVAGEETLSTTLALEPRITPAGAQGPGIFADPDGNLVAVNIPESESRLAPLPLDSWETLGVPLAERSAPAGPEVIARENAAARAPELIESEQRLWRWTLLAALILLATESFVAWRLANRKSGSARAPEPVS